MVKWCFVTTYVLITFHFIWQFYVFPHPWQMLPFAGAYCTYLSVCIHPLYIFIPCQVTFGPRLNAASFSPTRSSDAPLLSGVNVLQQLILLSVVSSNKLGDEKRSTYSFRRCPSNFIFKCLTAEFFADICGCTRPVPLQADVHTMRAARHVT
jgi:hypothetical protein